MSVNVDEKGTSTWALEQMQSGTFISVLRMNSDVFPNRPCQVLDVQQDFSQPDEDSQTRAIAMTDESTMSPG